MNFIHYALWAYLGLCAFVAVVWLIAQIPRPRFWAEEVEEESPNFEQVSTPPEQLPTLLQDQAA